MHATAMNPVMNCPTLETLSEYQAGLHADDEPLRAHIADCARCQQELAALLQTDVMLAAMPRVAPADDLWPAVSARLAGRPRRSYAWLWRGLAGAGAAAALFVAVTLSRTTPDTPMATPEASTYVAYHSLLGAQDPLADRASLAMLASTQGGGQ